MEDLSSAGNEIAVVLEVLRERNPVLTNALLTEVVVEIPNFIGVGPSTRHEAVPGRGTVRELHMGGSEEDTFRGQLIKIGCAGLDDAVSTRRRAIVIADDEKNVLRTFGCRFRGGCRRSGYSATELGALFSVLAGECPQVRGSGLYVARVRPIFIRVKGRCYPADACLHALAQFTAFASIHD
jgi:hypothetical protein